MREMRLNKREIKDPDMLRDIIESCDIVRLGLSDRDGMFIVPVNYGYDIETDGTNLISMEQKKAGKRKLLLLIRLSLLRWTAWTGSSPETIRAVIPAPTAASWAAARSVN